MEAAREARAKSKVLVADDDPQSARLLARILDAGGFGSVLTCTTSTEVEAACERERPDLLLLDLTMPQPDGFEILARIGPRLGSDLHGRVVVLTGHDHPAVERRAIDLGASAVLGKTAPRQELLERLDELIGG